MKYENDVEKILITQEEIAAKVEEIAETMNGKFSDDEEVVFVCILKGSISFYSDLVRKLSFPVQFDFMCISSYGAGSVSSGKVNIKKDLSVDINGKHVVIIEDILDTGNTLYALTDVLQKRNPKCIELCCLLDKPSRREKPVYPNYVGFEIPDEFVIGYGLDYNEKYRQLPYVGILKRSVYED